MAELGSGKEALDLYNKGIQILEQKIQLNQVKEDDKKDLCNGYNALAEMY